MRYEMWIVNINYDLYSLEQVLFFKYLDAEDP